MEIVIKYIIFYYFRVDGHKFISSKALPTDKEVYKIGSFNSLMRKETQVDGNEINDLNCVHEFQNFA